MPVVEKTRPNANVSMFESELRIWMKRGWRRESRGLEEMLTRERESVDEGFCCIAGVEFGRILSEEIFYLKKFMRGLCYIFIYRVIKVSRHQNIFFGMS